jgi:hypothetical protein
MSTRRDSTCPDTAQASYRAACRRSVATILVSDFLEHFTSQERIVGRQFLLIGRVPSGSEVDPGQ